LVMDGRRRNGFAPIVSERIVERQAALFHTRGSGAPRAHDTQR
jgi:hypothetical protein